MDFIKQHWDNVAGRSWNDVYMMDLEYREISKLITTSDTVLDVGCGDGSLLSKISALRRAGIDFSEKMIAMARKHKDIDFFVGDARNMAFKNSSFDVVYTVRCLINLPTWGDQMQAIKECLRVARKRVILAEAFYEPMQRLNALRQVSGLRPLEEHDYNRYLKEYKLKNFLTAKYYTVKYSSVYYLGTRFLREIICDYESYTSPINKMFFELSKELRGGDFGIQKIYVIEP